jgi:signal peptidase I
MDIPENAPEQIEVGYEEYSHSAIREYFVSIVVCSILALFVTTYVIHPMTVPTPSMEPTILVGDRLLIDKFNIRNHFLAHPFLIPSHSIQRHDVIVFKFPDQPELLYVKRAIGLPGDQFEIQDKKVYINNNPLSEPYKIHSDPYIYSKTNQHNWFNSEIKRDNFGPIKIPKDFYFVMGDNRDDSADSRYFGLLPSDHVVGQPLFIFWSYKDDSDAYLKTSPLELIYLYGERILFFLTRTRWDRIGQMIR